LLEDLTWIDRFRPHQVTWYILRFQRGSPWHALYTQGRLALPSDDDSVRRRLLLRRGMALLGYAARPGGRFARVQGAIDRFKKVRAGLDATLLGLGASAYSHGWGYFFRNAGTQPGAAGVDEYTARVDSGRWPIATGLALDTVEREAARLVSGLRSGVELPSSALEEGGLRAEAARRLRTLADQGLVQADGARFSLTEAGCLFEEEICSLFYSPAVKARLATSGAYWATETAQEDPAHVRRS
jgi:coproporphyrinogen III oxidase-like Fe-S oxidoreductase